MGALTRSQIFHSSPLPLGVLLLPQRPSSATTPTTHFSCISPIVLHLQQHTANPIISRRHGSAAVSATNSDEVKNESMFMDEDGVIDDMDGYLNYLSPEYESVWDTKPSWCQPWTITLTGVLVIGSSWLVLRSPLVTAVIAFLICSWWYIFLYSYPKAYTEMIAERRKRVKSGIEDTFGFGARESQ